MFRFILTLFISIYSSLHLLGQYTLSGTITNQKGESLSLAVIAVNDNLAVTSDSRGQFLLPNIPPGMNTILVTYLGYDNIDTLVFFDQDMEVNLSFRGGWFALDEIEILSNRVTNKDPFSYTNVNANELKSRNTGQDIPFLLNHTPSMVVTSDAGAGIGYTGMRLRGSDQTRINVTINDIPVNDPESHNVFWVNLPDIASSVNDIQIQRGVGSSTNGAGAYGGTVSLSTKSYQHQPFADVSLGLGSFNTQRIAVKLGSGLIYDKWSVEGRYSKIKSDGYIDRATSDLSSYFLSLARITPKSSLRFLVFSGAERTYQSWYGAPESIVKNDPQGLLDHYNRNLGTIYQNTQDSINLFSSDRRYNYYLYDNQVDNYGQTYYQAHYGYQISPKTNCNAALFTTIGKGYFEEYRYQDQLTNYGIQDSITNTNLIRRRWLDNDLLGALANITHDVNDKLTITTGGMYNVYIGRHFGQVISAEGISTLDRTRKYYQSRSVKTDYNGYIKLNAELLPKLLAYGDIQLRGIDYKAKGIDNGGIDINIDKKYTFLNPKFGLNYNLANGQIYGSLAYAQKEPNRSDFIDRLDGTTPLHEKLLNYELGYKILNQKSAFNANIYYMKYKDQLIPTGNLNDVGALLRTNIPDSYRIGLELVGSSKISQHWQIDGDLTLSRNKIKEFQETLYDYTNGFDVLTIYHNNKDIAFSPNVIARGQLTYFPFTHMGISLESKYVGRQYLDNTQSRSKSLNPYLVHSLRFNYQIATNKIFKSVEILGQVNNLLNSLYAANGYTYSYIFEELITENFLYPQAGIHFNLGVNLKW